jgi:uncharacterized protein (DUF3084 family)
MSTDTNESNTGGNDAGTTPTGNDTFTPITSQEQLNQAIGARLERERAKFGDYDDLRAKAAKLDEIEQANKTELEKAQEAANAATAERDQARAEALRLKVAVKHGIAAEDAELFLTGQDEQTLEAQAARLASRVADRKKNGAVVPGEGSGAGKPAGDLQAFTRQLFARNQP